MLVIEMGVHDETVTHGDEGTRERILDAAERLFAEKGFDGAPVREITAQAGCNIAAVNYHFGSKENLYREVFRRRLVALRDHRLARLEAVAGGEDRPSLEVVLEAFTRSFLEPLVGGGEGRLLMELWAREMLQPRLPRELFEREMLRPVQDALAGALRRAVPGLTEAGARLAVFSLVAQLVHVVHRLRLHDAATLPVDLEALTAHIVRFSAGGTRALAGGEGR